MLDHLDDTVPEAFEHILTWYGEIRARNARGQLFEPVSLQEIEAYRQKLARVGVEMDPLDEDLIAIVDGIWMDVVPEKPATPPK